MKLQVIVSIAIILLSNSTFSQDVIMVEYDFVKNESTLINFGETSLNENKINTNGFVGNSGKLISLETGIPNNNFVRLLNVEQTSSYPISTAVKIVSVQNGQKECSCSGTMISKRHILTAAHCFLEVSFNNLTADSLLVFPGFNNGVENDVFGNHFVIKAYSFVDWTLNGNDIMVLEINNDLGLKTGWLGVAFNNDDNELRDMVYYKYSYPCSTQFTQYEGKLNGDTLYYSYGIYDIVDKFISSQFPEPDGFIGESGSSIFLNNKNSYNVYGVLTWSGRLKHSRIDDWEFWGISNILDNQLTTSTINFDELKIELYPNPCVNRINVDINISEQISIINIYSKLGVLMFSQLVEDKIEIEIDKWPTGMYHVLINTNGKIGTAKFIKDE